jgi:hypothetical protein
MRRFEHVLVGLDDGAAGALLRVGLGYVTGLAWLQLIGLQAPGWTVVPFFLAVLASVRLLPAVIRKVGRFSEPVRSVWTGRRQMAKRYDSYQWQKLFWIGLGLGLQLALAARRSGALVALALFCLIAGTLGLATWRAIGGGANRSGSTGTRAATSGKGTVADVLTMGSKA